ncbi:MAG: WXG100 family type VII secretion target [Lachnospiraceae bacterium]|nr:WXG100 family type VII secretion target [Lachnospiraceae bacterium]MDD7378888.1 WXG100 family type VII secretion target [Lachnospiraceae bacterium]MDY4618182.1 WXG100 family type VII secretion target [Lachnospiraceae bacterium]
MGNQLSMQYSDMEAAIQKLQTECTNFENTTRSMTNHVNSLCDAWKADASPIYKQDYAKLTKNFDKTLQVVRELIKSTNNYINDMKQLDKSYSKSKIQ